MKTAEQLIAEAICIEIATEAGMYDKDCFAYDMQLHDYNIQAIKQYAIDYYASNDAIRYCIDTEEFNTALNDWLNI